MSTLTPPEDQLIRTRSKSITLDQPQTATPHLSETGKNTLQVSSPLRSKSMLVLSTPQQETTAENNTTNPRSLVVIQLKNKHGDNVRRIDSQESLNRPGSIIVRDFGSQESFDDLRKATNRITKRKVRFADNLPFDGSRNGEENMFDCEINLWVI
ncbi:uncharacterized protein EAE97_000801 [Botrytis byssoidea]|uniref:Uncharacterized protein n=1 Tax=Botrytis byssoidea TaxID=139641 RepID=A0A9P5IVX9_9HELO|nr:uncharacterized protein EAE97_000801 [Botrytis byssoidea]KAF7953402.1 hypothetical protein EAE97_000801 [Botrytis byssoidea]